MYLVRVSEVLFLDDFLTFLKDFDVKLNQIPIDWIPLLCMFFL